MHATCRPERPNTSRTHQGGKGEDVLLCPSMHLDCAQSVPLPLSPPAAIDWQPPPPLFSRPVPPAPRPARACGSYVCRTLHPKLKKIAIDNPDMAILKVNGSSDALREVFARYHVTRVPYFKLIRGGKVRSSFSASLSPEKLALLRAEIAAAKSPNFSDADNAAYSDWEC